jgi:periplasmic divalent cation tolerance protein
MNEAIFLYTTWPDAETAEGAAAAAVEQGLAACANLFAPILSIYRWEGSVETTQEVPAIFKTTTERASALQTLILALHPYDLPCMVALPVSAASSHPAFLAWITAATSQK